jgi:hypothetical protein
VPAGRLLPRIALAFATGLAASAAQAEFQDDYALGLQAIDEARYQDARKYLERALAAQSEPVDKVILNGNIEQPYLPYHFLGIIAYKLGECDAAKAQWGNPTNRRMTGRLNQIRQQEQRLADSCQPKVAAAKENSTSTQTSAAPEQQAVVPPSPVPAEKAPKPAMGKERTTAKRPDSEKPGAEKTTPVEKPIDIAAQPERLPPPRLVRAIDNYLAGRYAEAARIEPESFPAARTRFHAYLVRAAARYTQAQLNGDKDLLAAARADADAAHKLAPALKLDEALFSPKFRAFYAQSH